MALAFKWAYNDQYSDHICRLLVKELTIMSKEKSIVFPSLQRLLAELGQNIHLARLRRGFSASIVSERAGISRNTLRAIERGEPSVAFGAYANVLLSLGLEKDLSLIAHDDDLGRKLQDAGLHIKARAPRVHRFKAKKKTK